MNMKNICQYWWFPSTYEFFRTHSMFNGRECSRKYICSFYCWSYVFWQGFCREIHGHLLCTSAVLSLLLEEFCDRTSSEEKSQLAKIFDMFNLKITLAIVWRILCHGLKTRSLNYHLNLEPQRSGLTIHNTYQLHSSLSEQSKKVTGNYMLKPQNTCWTFLLLLAITTMQRLADFISNQQYHWRRIIHIYLGSLCQEITLSDAPKKTVPIFARTDLSIEQILMKSLKGREGKIWSKHTFPCS